MRDDLELTVLAETGDLVFAEYVGIAVGLIFEMLSAVLGFDCDVAV